ncbi:MAG: hypothetical protein ACE5JJ_06210 [Nitrospinota bacterium]
MEDLLLKIYDWIYEWAKSVLLKIYEWAQEFFEFLEREWELRWDLYTLLGAFLLFLVFLRFVYLPRRLAALATRGGVARGGGKDAPHPPLLTCTRCESTFPLTDEARESFCPYCGTLVFSPPGARRWPWARPRGETVDFPKEPGPEAK